MTRRIWAAVPLLVALGLPHPAQACSNAVQLAKASPQLVAKAEAALAAGRYKRAFLLLDTFTSSDEALARRIALVHAVADMRYSRHPMTASGHHSVSPIKALRALLKSDPDNPLLRARVAEAQSYYHPVEPIALATLVDLEQRDLMPDAEAWATLARLRHRASDPAGRDRALARCKSAAVRPDVCPVFDAATAPASARATP